MILNREDYPDIKFSPRTGDAVRDEAMETIDLMTHDLRLESAALSFAQIAAAIAVVRERDGLPPLPLENLLRVVVGGYFPTPEYFEELKQDLRKVGTPTRPVLIIAGGTDSIN